MRRPLPGWTVEERYHNARLIVTSQVKPQGWLKLFEDPVLGEAIVDRLIHSSQKITLKGEKSYREKLNEQRSSLKNDGRVKVNSSKIASSLLRSAQFSDSQGSPQTIAALVVGSGNE